MVEPGPPGIADDSCGDGYADVDADYDEKNDGEDGREDGIVGEFRDWKPWFLTLWSYLDSHLGLKIKASIKIPYVVNNYLKTRIDIADIQ